MLKWIERRKVAIDRLLATPTFATIATLGIFIWSLAAAAVLLLSGIQHDYELYLAIWRHVEAGGDPWQATGIPVNAYGPLFTWFSYLLAVGGPDEAELLPKLVFGGSLLTVNLWLVLMLLRRDPKAGVSSWLAYLLLVPLNYLVIGNAFIDGNNDTLVAALVGIAVVLRLRSQLAWAGVLLGVAVLMKYYPALLIPFFCLDRREFRVTPAITSAAAVAAGILLTYLQWGGSFLTALTFGATRSSGSLSIIHFLGTQGWVPSDIYKWLLSTNSLAVLGAMGVLFAAGYAMRLTWLEGSMLASLTMVMCYMVGHQQFLLAWIVLLVGLLVEGSRRSEAQVYVSLPLVVFMSAYQAVFHVYWWAGLFLEREAEFVRDQVGLPFFTLGMLTVLLSFATARRLGTPADLDPIALPAHQGH